MLALARMGTAIVPPMQAFYTIRSAIGQADPDWPDWYAQYMMQERAAQGTTT